MVSLKYFIKFQTTILALIVLFLSVPIFVSAETKDTVAIGAILHLTGPYASEGTAFHEGIQLAVQKLNAAGGVNGRLIKLIVEDTHFSLKDAHTAAKKLLEINKIEYGVVSTISEVKSVGPLFEAHKVPLMVLWDSDPEIEKIGQHIFGIGAWGPSTGEVVAQFAKKQLNAKKAVIVKTENLWSNAVGAYFERKFTQEGGVLQATFSLDPQEQDFKTVVSKLRLLATDVVYAPLSPNFAAFFKQAYEAKLNIPLITSDVLTGAVLTELADSIEGVYQTLTPDPDDDSVKELLALYEKNYKRKAAFPLLSAWGYDSVMLYAEAETKLHAEKLKSLSDAFYTIKDFPGSSGKISINERGSSPTEAQMYRISKQTLVKVEPQ